MEFDGKRVLVVGMARSGVAAAELLLNGGAIPIINDAKAMEAFGDELQGLLDTKAEFHLGEDPLALLEKADAVIISPGVPIDAPLVKAAREKVIPLIGELELGALFDQSRMVAITGTNGKTTTVTLLCEIFKNAGKISRTAGNIGIPYSRVAMEAKEDDITVCEVSSFQLETVETFHPKVAAILNITEDHLNRHGTMAEYIRLKMRIFENQTEEDVAVLNFDDALLKDKADGIKSRVMWFSRESAVTLGAFVEDGCIMCAFDGEIRKVVETDQVRIPGPHNLENALAATCVATAMGVPAPVIRHTLRTFEGVEHRIEFVRTLEGITFINDSKGTNVDSTIKAVQTMKDQTIIILGGYDKKTDFAPLAAEIAETPFIRGAVVIGQTAEAIKGTLKEKGFHNVKSAESLEHGISLARESLGGSGNVLLSPACASFDMFKDYEERGRVFKEIVLKL